MTPVIILMIFFCNAYVFQLLFKLLKQIIPYFIIDWKYAKQIDLRVSVLLICDMHVIA
jgi:hypothetical protein